MAPQPPVQELIAYVRGWLYRQCGPGAHLTGFALEVNNTPWPMPMVPYVAEAAAPEPPPPFIPTQMQRRILDALDGRALTKDALAEAVGCEANALYRDGDIRGLMDRGAVLNDRKQGGYYRPDAPPG